MDEPDLDDLTKARIGVLACLDHMRAAWGLLVEDLYVLKRREAGGALYAYATLGHEAAANIEGDLANFASGLFTGVSLGFLTLRDAKLNERDRVGPVNLIRNTMEQLVALRPRIVAEWGLEAVDVDEVEPTS